MDEKQDAAGTASFESSELIRFADSYESFNRIINSLQRQYIELKEEFSEQNAKLAQTNRQLVEMTSRNLAANEFLNSILTSVSVGIIAVDKHGLITHFNPAASIMLGFPVGQVLGKHYRDCVPPGSPIEANALRAVESGKAVESVEKKLELPDGTRLLVSVSTAILRDNEGRAVGAVEVFHDLTRLKKMENEITRLTTLAALGEMAATVAHEVRNPLAGIGGFASLLKRDLHESDPRHKQVDKIITGVETLNHIVTTLLNYTRSEEMNKEEVDMASFVRGTIEQYRHDNFDKLRQIYIQFVPDDQARVALKAHLDPMMVRQVLFNLISNAVDASNDGGRVEITCRKLPRQKAVERYAERLLLGLDETVIETTVSDFGPGIDPQHLDQIFSPFFTTKQNGTGLGLAVSWKIAKAHGGDIVADNKPSGGARFVLAIPTKVDHVDMEHSV